MEILSTGNELEDAITAIRNKQALKTAEKLARERELAKVKKILNLFHKIFLREKIALWHFKNKLEAPFDVLIFINWINQTY